MNFNTSLGRSSRYFYACSMPCAASMQAGAAQGRSLPKLQEYMQPQLQGMKINTVVPVLACMTCLPFVSRLMLE